MYSVKDDVTDDVASSHVCTLHRNRGCLGDGLFSSVLDNEVIDDVIASRRNLSLNICSRFWFLICNKSYVIELMTSWRRWRHFVLDEKMISKRVQWSETKTAFATLDVVATRVCCYVFLWSWEDVTRWRKWQVRITNLKFETFSMTKAASRATVHFRQL